MALLLRLLTGAVPLLTAVILAPAAHASQLIVHYRTATTGATRASVRPAAHVSLSESLALPQTQTGPTLTGSAGVGSP